MNLRNGSIDPTSWQKRQVIKYIEIVLIDNTQILIAYLQFPWLFVINTDGEKVNMKYMRRPTHGKSYSAKLSIYGSGNRRCWTKTYLVWNQSLCGLTQGVRQALYVRILWTEQKLSKSTKQKWMEKTWIQGYILTIWVSVFHAAGP